MLPPCRPPAKTSAWVWELSGQTKTGSGGQGTDYAAPKMTEPATVLCRSLTCVGKQGRAYRRQHMDRCCAAPAPLCVKNDAPLQKIQIRCLQAKAVNPYLYFIIDIGIWEAYFRNFLRIILFIILPKHQLCYWQNGRTQMLCSPKFCLRLLPAGGV